MAIDKSKSQSGKMSAKEAFKALGLPREATIDEINRTFKDKLAEIQQRNNDKPDKLVQEGVALYDAYRSAYLSKDNADENEMLPLTMSGPETMLNIIGINEIPHQSLEVQMKAKAHYKDGQLVRKESNRTESFINKDGKREIKVIENGKVIKHTIDGKNMLK